MAAATAGRRDPVDIGHVPKVFAVVVCMNNREDVIRCVRSLLETEYPGIRVIVVDNASTDGSVEALRAEYPSMQILRNERNVGYAAGANCGIRMALEQGAEYVLVSNSDIVVDRHFLMLVIRVAEGSPEVGVLIPTIRYAGDRDKIYYAAGRMSRLLCTGLTTTWRSASLMRAGEPVEVNFVNGAIVLFRRGVFERLGLLDEKFFLYHDDNEFSIRYGKEFRMMYVPRAVVYHACGAGVGWRGYSETYLYYYTRNRMLLFNEETAAYRAYVAFYTIVNAAAKSLVIATNFLSRRTMAQRQLRALWLGVRDGIRIWAYGPYE